MVAAAVGKIRLKLDVRWRGNVEAAFYKLTFDYEKGGFFEIVLRQLGQVGRV